MLTNAPRGTKDILPDTVGQWTYVEEKTLALLMIDVDEGIVREIAKDLCAFFRQESVMVTSSPVDVVFVRETVGGV